MGFFKSEDMPAPLFLPPPTPETVNTIQRLLSNIGRFDADIESKIWLIISDKAKEFSERKVSPIKSAAPFTTETNTPERRW